MTEKANGELWLAERFVEAHNRLFRTDFVAEAAAAEKDSADAYLVSKSKALRIGLQICLATTQDRMREEAIQDRLQRKISETLMAKGLSDCFIGIGPREMPQKEHLTTWHDEVVKLVLENYPKEGEKAELEDGGMGAPFGKLPFSTLTISRGSIPDKWKKWVIVNFFVVKDVLEVEPTIQQALDKKVAKNYSDAASLWLLLQPSDGAHSAEIVELMTTHLKNVGKFAQVWWVYPQRDVGTEIYRFDEKNGFVQAK